MFFTSSLDHLKGYLTLTSISKALDLNPRHLDEFLVSSTTTLSIYL